jgi:hypothetical protein
MTSLITRLAQAASGERAISPFVGNLHKPESTAANVVAGDAECFCFSSNGLKLITNVGTNLYNEYNLSVAWDINTKTFVGQVDLTAIRNVLGAARDIALFGTNFYVLTGLLYRYNLTVSNTLVGSTITSNALDAVSVDLDSITFSADGLTAIGKTNGSTSLKQYNTTVAFNIRTANFTFTDELALEDPYVNVPNASSTEYGNFAHVAPDGINVLLCSSASFIGGSSYTTTNRTPASSTGAITSKKLNTAWDLTAGWAAVQDTVWTLGANGIRAKCVKFNDDGTKYYTTELTKYRAAQGYGSGDEYTIGQYPASTPYIVGISTSELLTPVETNLIGNRSFISFDGNYCFCSNSTGDFVYRYTLDTPWDVTSANPSYVTYDLRAAGNAEIDNPDAFNYHIRFSQNGLYVWGFNRQYTLTTPWDMTSITYAVRATWSTAGINGQRAFLRFNRTGTKAIIVKADQGSTGNNSVLSPRCGLDGINSGNYLTYPQAIVVQVFNISSPFNPTTATFVEQKVIDSGFASVNTDAAGNSDILASYMSMVDFDVSGNGREIYVMTPFRWAYRITLGAPWTTSQGVTVNLDKYALGDPSYADYSTLRYDDDYRMQIKPTGKRMYLDQLGALVQQVDLW